MSKVVRSVKNVTKGYSSVQVKVRNATSNDPWGPSGTEMSEIAQMTFNSSTDFYEIMDMLDKRLNDKGKNWRHVLKSLKVLDYCLHEGSELVVTWARKNVYIIKTLREFQYIDEDGRDVGQNIRVSAKELTALILDEDRLRSERADRKTWKSRVTGIEDGPPGFGGGSGDPSSLRERPPRQSRKGQNDEDDLEYKLAIEASKNAVEEDAKRRARISGVQPDDDDLAKAIKLSREEEDLRRRQLEETNAQSLFDDMPAQPAQAQPTGYNQGYQQGSVVDWFGDPMDHQQPQATGYLNNAYSQSTGFQNQQTGFQNGFGYSNPYQQPLTTGFDHSQYQQPPATYLQPQQTSFSFNNPYGQQSTGFGIGHQQHQQPIEQQNTVHAGSNNPWSGQQPHDTLKPLPTGSNNPFASSINRSQTSPQNRIPTLNSLQEQQVQTQFTSQPYNPPPSFSSQPTQQARETNPHHAQLNALLATGEGQDTFGNVGNLRIPAQHTAPGTFVNSAGQGIDRLHASQTGNNPFFKSQFTGMPQQTGFTQQPQQGRMVPAQTGPAAAFGGTGFGNAGNPFGRQQGGQQQSGSLIDL